MRALRATSVCPPCCCCYCCCAQATTAELERLKESSDAATERAQALEAAKARLEKDVHTLQQNNTKLVLTNLMLFNQNKHLEDNSRQLVAKNEDLQHQVGRRTITDCAAACGAARVHEHARSTRLAFSGAASRLCGMLHGFLPLCGACLQNEQLQRDTQTELAALKEQVSGVLNRYLSKDMDLQQALEEMQRMGIELVPAASTDGRCAARVPRPQLPRMACALQCCCASLACRPVSCGQAVLRCT